MSTALLIIDMQNDFVWPGAPMETPGAVDIIPAVSSVRAFFDAKEWPVIHTRYIGDPWVHRLRDQVPWVETVLPPTRACVPGQRRSFDGIGDVAVEAIIDELAPKEDELVIDKVFYSAFSETSLHEELQKRGITSLAIVGIQTECCVDDTARYAVHLGYDVTLVSDGTAAGVPENQDWALRNFVANYGTVVDSVGLMKSLNSANMLDPND